jgi:hypothetical protein
MSTKTRLRTAVDALHRLPEREQERLVDYFEDGTVQWIKRKEDTPEAIIRSGVQ